MYGRYEEIGRSARPILDVLPLDWSFKGKRMLDFGCGAGRVLRQFADEARSADMRGCDIDGPSVDWVNAHLSPPFSAVRNGEQPPLLLAGRHVRLDHRHLRLHSHHHLLE